MKREQLGKKWTRRMMGWASVVTIALLLNVGLVSMSVAGSTVPVPDMPIPDLRLGYAEEGYWDNYDPNTRGITKIHVRSAYNGARLYVHLWGACHPTDCDWGEVPAYKDSNGWIRATYYHGYATRYVWSKLYPGYTRDWLRVYIWTDFGDPNRKDYAMDNWFNRRITEH